MRGVVGERQGDVVIKHLNQTHLGQLCKTPAKTPFRYRTDPEKKPQDLETIFHYFKTQNFENVSIDTNSIQTMQTQAILLQMFFSNKTVITKLF